MTRRIAAGAALLYLLTLVAAPLVDPARDVLRSYPEDYSPGPADALVRAGYVSVAVMAAAIAWVAVRQGGLARTVAGTMLVAAAAVSATLAVAPQQVTGGPLLAGVILGLVIAPLVLSIAGRHDTPRAPVVMGIVVSVGFLSLMAAPREVAGITNRVWDVLLALWGLAFTTRPAAAPSRHAR